MDISQISAISGVVLTMISIVIAVLKSLKSSKNKKIANSANTALETLYAVRDAMFAVESKNYDSTDKKTVATSLAKETCRKQRINCSDEGINSSIDFIMEIGNNINARKATPNDSNNQSDTKVGVVVSKSIYNNFEE